LGDFLLYGFFSGGESDYRRVLKPDGQVILMKAISSLEAAMRSLNDGTTEFQMLRLLNDHSENFLALCEHINKQEGKLSSLRQLLHQRCSELTEFQEEREKVTIFIRLCALLKQGIQEDFFSLLFQFLTI